MTRKTAYERSTPRRKKSRKSSSMVTRIGLLALSRLRLPLWAKIALGVVALGSAGYTSGLSGKLGIDSMLRKKQTP